jgi:hypothetical protein
MVLLVAGAFGVVCLITLDPMKVIGQTCCCFPAQESIVYKAQAGDPGLTMFGMDLGISNQDTYISWTEGWVDEYNYDWDLTYYPEADSCYQKAAYEYGSNFQVGDSHPLAAYSQYMNAGWQVGYWNTSPSTGIYTGGNNWGYDYNGYHALLVNYYSNNNFAPGGAVVNQGMLMFRTTGCLAYYTRDSPGKANILTFYIPSSQVVKNCRYEFDEIHTLCDSYSGV